MSAASPVRTVSCIVPAHNEAALIAATLRTIAAGWAHVPGYRLSEIVVVDDGSNDSTSDIVRQLAHSLPCVRLLRQPQRGKGAAVRSGVLASTGDVVYFIDADLPFGPEDHVRLTTHISSNRPVVCGFRRAEGDGHAHSSLGRHAASLVFGVLARGITGLRLRNSQCGLKAFDGDLARHYFGQLTEPGFAMDVELLARITRDGVGVTQLPIVLRPEQRMSYVSPLRTGVAMTRALFRIRRALAVPSAGPVLRTGTGATAAAAAGAAAAASAAVPVTAGAAEAADYVLPRS